jgi:hypothetical protein
MNESVRGGRSKVWVRVALAFLSLGELAVGIWALFLPRSFYEDFPSSGRDWVSTLGPYDEHLTQTHAFSMEDNLAQLVSLGFQVALPVAILFGAGLRDKGHSEEVGR